MVATDPGSAREEAERLVATLLATARSAGDGTGPWGPLGGIVSSVLGHSTAPSVAGGGGLATGTAECCICPVCRAIAALRDPSPEFAERLATGAGDLAAGVASLLRAFASAEPPHERADASASATRDERTEDHVWREATRNGQGSPPVPEAQDSPPAPEADVWSAATRARETVVPAVAPPADVAGPATLETTRAKTDRVGVPASRAPAEAGEDARGV
ncbi:hypothetical protein QTQ03_10790 [Micromonospora sp. WMMA1363]|uniref:hypothetical protein n=1 Tax=Micromonospora sp. WMMA1363 TaxID=3053985 RepID=UPI00259C98C8|nr:hypothetical protein [Micromonospora sp. WMMA1363]MDM4720041.1 hypothetical protein [Micromonospora sp. WMMA1363]